MNGKVTNSIINKVEIKHWDEDLDEFDVLHIAKDVQLTTFINYLDNLSTIASVNWSLDFLNPGYTRATVYLEF